MTNSFTNMERENAKNWINFREDFPSRKAFILNFVYDKRLIMPYDKRYGKLSYVSSFSFPIENNFKTISPLTVA